MENVVIVGSGPAGWTAAIYCARALLSPVVLAGPTPGGLLTQTSDIENFPGFPEAVNGYELMAAMQRQAERFGAKVLMDTLKSCSLRPGGPHGLELESGASLACKALVIATGARPNWLGLEGERRLAAKGVSACATCDGAFFRNVPVVVVGGGDSAMEEAIFLTRFASKVTVIHRRKELRASRIMAERAMSNPKIEFRWNSAVVDILGSDEVEGVRLRDLETGALSDLPCKGYFAALGHSPATEVFDVAKDAKGYIVLQGGGSATSVPGVFAAGDCADGAYRQAITAAGMGCRAAIDAERWLESVSRSH